VTILALSTSTIAVLVVIGILDLFAVVFGLNFLRARKADRALQAAGPGEALPPAPKPISRRDFFRGSLLVSFFVFLAEFGGASIAFLWPTLKGGFGSTINAGSLDDIKAGIQDSNGQPAYNGAGRFYLVTWNGQVTADVDYPGEGVTADGIMPLYQRCVHLGCRVPFCPSSKWFECPCHGSKYNGAGEYQLGPAPRGMDRFTVKVEGGNVFVDTSLIILGPPRGTDTIQKPPQGPYCV
jgi:cytochrome b6-f complex iron-sulfur subunit